MKESLFSFSLLFECFSVFVERSASLGDISTCMGMDDTIGWMG